MTRSTTATATVVAALTLALSLQAPAAHTHNHQNHHTPHNQPEWVNLIQGDTLKEGWATTWGSLDAWAIIDDEIRVVNPGQGGWLRTTKTYRDFELKLDFLIPEGGNSGVGLRCTSAGDPAFTGFEVQIYDSYGDDPSRAACGAVYNAIPPRVQAVNPPGQWNSYHITVIGDTLNVWLNGVHIHDDQKLDDRGIFRNDDQPLPLNERATTGFIAFQDHGEGGLRLRNIQIKDRSPDPDPGDFTPAFPDQTTNGWTQRGGGSFTFEGHTLVAADGPGHLFSNQTHTDIELRALVRVPHPDQPGERTGNSGIYVRTVPNPSNPDTWPLGYECQIDHHDPRNYTGCIYDRAPANPGEPVSRDGTWFDYRILVTGNRVRTFINSVPMADAILDNFNQGSVVLQTHHPGNRVEFRDIRWRTPTPDDH